MNHVVGWAVVPAGLVAAVVGGGRAGPRLVVQDMIIMTMVRRRMMMMITWYWFDVFDSLSSLDSLRLDSRKSWSSFCSVITCWS